MFSRSVILQASSFERLSILFYNSGWYHERPFAVVSRCVQRCAKAIIIMEVLHRAATYRRSRGQPGAMRSAPGQPSRTALPAPAAPEQGPSPGGC